MNQDGPPCAQPGCAQSPYRHVTRWATASPYTADQRVTDHPYTNTTPKADK